MAKISQVSAKYIVHSTIEIEGIVDRPDVIGAIFGQTEGLLGADLELRELQRSGRIGRIEVEMNTKTGKTSGTIIIPSSLDKAETSIIAASLEIIQRIGPCNAKIKVENIEDIRITKRDFVISRAKELLRNMVNTTSPDSQELADEVQNAVRVMEIAEYGPDKLPAGPSIDEGDEVIIVEGRADVMNLLKHGFKNVISTNGTNTVSPTLIDLTKRKTCTLFTDGDRGGDLIIKQILSVCEIDYITKAPDGKEVEEITKKEIHKSLRSRIAAEQVKLEIDSNLNVDRIQESSFKKVSRTQQQLPQQGQSGQPQAQQFQQERRPYQQGQAQGNFRQERRPYQQPVAAVAPIRKPVENTIDKGSFKKLLEDLVGTNGAYILNEKKEILGKVPMSELSSTVKSLGTGIFAIVLDGTIEAPLLQVAERAEVRYIIGMESKVKPNTTRITLMTVDEL